MIIADRVASSKFRVKFVINCYPGGERGRVITALTTAMLQGDTYSSIQTVLDSYATRYYPIQICYQATTVITIGIIVFSHMTTSTLYKYISFHVPSGAIGLVVDGRLTPPTCAQGWYHGSAVTMLWYDTSTRSDTVLPSRQTTVVTLDTALLPLLEWELPEDPDTVLRMHCVSSLGSCVTFTLLELMTVREVRYW